MSVFVGWTGECNCWLKPNYVFWQSLVVWYLWKLVLATFLVREIYVLYTDYICIIYWFTLMYVYEYFQLNHMKLPFLLVKNIAAYQQVCMVTQYVCVYIHAHVWRRESKSEREKWDWEENGERERNVCVWYMYVLIKVTNCRNLCICIQEELLYNHKDDTNCGVHLVSP